MRLRLRLLTATLPLHNCAPGPCEDCVTQDTACDITCSAPFEGTLGTNVISEINGVSEELTCKQMCQEEDLCSLYTYRRANSTSSPETCYLLSSIGSPVAECADETCATGVPDCSGDSSFCAYLQDGVIMQQGVKLTGRVGQETRPWRKNVTLIRLGECPSPIAVVIGGGGSGDIGGTGGGGSGYISHGVLDLPPSAYINLVVLAGTGGYDGCPYLW